MMGGGVLVSVCLPVRNGADYVGEALGSVLAQDVDGLEVIVSDNCSVDDTAEIIRTFGDRRVVYTRSEAVVSQVANFNRALGLTRGEFVCVFHHDDVMVPGNLRQKLELLRTERKLGFVHSNVLQIDSVGSCIGEHWDAESRKDYVWDGLRFMRYAICRVNPVSASSVVMRGECVRRAGQFREGAGMACDLDMWFRMALLYSVGCLGQALVKHRWVETSVTQRLGVLRMLADDLRVRRWASELFLAAEPGGMEVWRRAMDQFSERAVLMAHRAFRGGNAWLAWKLVVLAGRASPAAVARVWGRVARRRAGGFAKTWRT